jgi:hypothetical protein
MRFAIDPWDPSYGSAADDLGDAAEQSAVVVDLNVELAPDAWRPVRPAPISADARHASEVVFVDGVRRVDARVWLPGESPAPACDAAVRDRAVPGVCASWAAGAVRCTGGRAEVSEVEVGRSVAAPSSRIEPIQTTLAFYEPVVARDATPEALWLAVQQAMGLAERRVAERAVGSATSPDTLVVVDGPLHGREHLPTAIGYVKSHHVRYLDGVQDDVLQDLAAGERTPVFTIVGSFMRHSWYLRLPLDGFTASTGQRASAPWAGIVRCECAPSVSGRALIDLADRTAAVLPWFASAPHKDRRAPQNLTPIAGLERILRHRMGDAALLYRSLRQAASAAA